MIFVMHELIFYFFIAIASGVPTLFLLLLVYLMPKQAKRLLKARILKRGTLIVGRQNATLDIVVPKMDATGILEAGKHERYLPPSSMNPVVTKRYFWANTGIPVFVADGRKAIYTSPETLTAIEVAEAKKKDELPEAIKTWAEQQKVTVTVQSRKKEDEEPTFRKKVTKLIYVNIAKLKEYFADAIDIDAEDVLYDKAFEEGRRSAGNQYMKMAIPIIAILGMLIVVLALIFVGGGMI